MKKLPKKFGSYDNSVYFCSVSKINRMTTLAINKLWANYPLSPEIVEMTLKNRKNVSDDIDETLYSAMEEKYRLRFF